MNETTKTVDGMPALVVVLSIVIIVMLALHATITGNLREERDSYKALAHAERDRANEAIGKAGRLANSCTRLTS